MFLRSNVVAFSTYPPTIFVRAVAQNLDVIAAALFAYGLASLARLVQAPDGAAGVMGYSAFVLAFLLADALPSGQSVGKRVLGLAVVCNADGQPCTAARSFVRNLFVVLGLLDWAFMLGRTRRRLGDHAAGTRVVRVLRSA